MARRIWVISKKNRVKKSDIDDAKLNGCSEIANGIPPSLKGIIGALPCAYEEPELPPPEPVRDPLAEIAELRTELKEKGIL